MITSTHILGHSLFGKNYLGPVAPYQMVSEFADILLGIVTGTFAITLFQLKKYGIACGLGMVASTTIPLHFTIINFIIKDVRYCMARKNART